MAHQADVLRVSIHASVRKRRVRVRSYGPDEYVSIHASVRKRLQAEVQRQRQRAFQSTLP